MALDKISKTITPHVAVVTRMNATLIVVPLHEMYLLPLFAPIAFPETVLMSLLTILKGLSIFLDCQASDLVKEDWLPCFACPS